MKTLFLMFGFTATLIACNSTQSGDKTTNNVGNDKLTGTFTRMATPAYGKEWDTLVIAPTSDNGIYTVIKKWRYDRTDGTKAYKTDSMKATYDANGDFLLIDKLQKKIAAATNGAVILGTTRFERLKE